MLRALWIPLLTACAVLAGSAPLVRKEMATGEGRISYEVRAGAGPRLILIHGSFNDNRQWDDVVPRLDAGLQLLLVELRGHGQSWPPPANGSIEQFAADVARVAQAEGWDKFYVGGHSIGGMVALELGRAYPQRVLGVLSSEGWTCHEALRDAFQGQTDITLTPEQKAHRAALRERATGRWTDAQRKAFRQLWRRWNGYEFLKTTGIPDPGSLWRSGARQTHLGTVAHSAAAQHPHAMDGQRLALAATRKARRAGLGDERFHPRRGGAARAREAGPKTDRH